MVEGWKISARPPIFYCSKSDSEFTNCNSYPSNSYINCTWAKYDSTCPYKDAADSGCEICATCSPSTLASTSSRRLLEISSKYIGEGEGVSSKEHLVAFYSYADNHNIEHEDCWSRLFVQSLDGEAHK